MTSQIDPTVPIVGTPTTASVRANFQIAHDEITALQNAANAVQASQVAISPAIGSLGPNVQSGLQWLNTNMTPMTVTANYLPLVGGTLTGTLNGTAVVLSGGVFAKAESRTTANAGSDSISTFYNSTPTRVGYVGWEHVSNTIRMNNDIATSSFSLPTDGTAVATGPLLCQVEARVTARAGADSITTFFNSTPTRMGYVGWEHLSNSVRMSNDQASSSFSLNPAGQAVASGQIFCLNESRVSGGSTALASFYNNAAVPIGYIGWLGSGGNLVINNDTAPGVQVSLVGVANMFSLNSGAQKPGGGSWLDSSDARIKTVLGDYTTGLDAILALRPVTYSFMGNDTPSADVSAPAGLLKDGEKAPTIEAAPYPSSTHYRAALDGTRYVGFIAQELETICPDMVTARDGFIDGEAVTDLRDVDTSNLIYALVNAVKTLAADVAALKAGTTPQAGG